MKKKLYLLLFLQGSICAVEELESDFLCFHDTTSLKVYESSLALCMEIWTELDLLGAIRTSTEDLMFFADKIIARFLVLQNLLSMVKIYHDIEPYSYEDVENICDLARQIDDRFYDIFDSIHSKEVACCTVLIERVLNKLGEFTFKSTM